MEARLAVTLFCYKPSIFYVQTAWYSHASKPVNMIIYINEKH